LQQNTDVTQYPTHTDYLANEQHKSEEGTVKAKRNARKKEKKTKERKKEKKRNMTKTHLLSTVSLNIQVE
jgi:hypothetical protein